jgi:transcriptional regulator with XRE-family HTH domain
VSNRAALDRRDGLAIRTVRLALHLSQARVAREAGLPASYLCAVETGVWPPSENVKQRVPVVLAKYMDDGISVTDLRIVLFGTTNGKVT